MSLAVQWLRLCASSAGGAGSIPGRGTKIPHAVQHGQILKSNKNKNKNIFFDKTFFNELGQI